jgi:hypothetical protein
MFVKAERSIDLKLAYNKFPVIGTDYLNIVATHRMARPAGPFGYQASISIHDNDIESIIPNVAFEMI